MKKRESAFVHAHCVRLTWRKPLVSRLCPAVLSPLWSLRECVAPGLGDDLVGDIDTRIFARNAGTNVGFLAGTIVFKQGDPGTCMYVVQSGMIEMVIGAKASKSADPARPSG